MTGAYIRIERDGKWQNIEVENLTVEERKEVFKGREPEELLRWIDMLCQAVCALELNLESLEMGKGLS